MSREEEHQKRIKAIKAEIEAREQKIREILGLIAKALKPLSELPKMQFPELLKDHNNLLWCIDGIAESYERMQTENTEQDIFYYENQINLRYQKIRENYLHLLN